MARQPLSERSGGEIGHSASELPKIRERKTNAKQARHCGIEKEDGENMFLKNYTSNVPITRTIQRIEQVLIQCGIKGITKEYSGTDGEIVALTFRIVLDDGAPLEVRLPAHVNLAQDALWLDYVGTDQLSSDGKSLYWNNRKRRNRASFSEQAERTAWKIAQEWIEIEMSRIQLKQAEKLEVFLPYVWDGKRTYFQSLKESKYAGLLPEKCEFVDS